jgi:hypothetical protein
MMRWNDAIADLLEPVRDLYVSELLEAMAAELEAGGEVDAEPVDRDGEGRVRRRPPLDLPARQDLAVRRAGRTLTRRVPGEAALTFRPMTADISDVAAVRIAPFNWGACEVRCRGAAGRPNWTPVRRWFLEWFQARFGEESPDLFGVAHRLDGPVEEPGGWRFTVDLGSASVAGFAQMLAAFAQTGCQRIEVGETEDAL